MREGGRIDGGGSIVIVVVADVGVGGSILTVVIGINRLVKVETGGV